MQVNPLRTLAAVGVVVSAGLFVSLLVSSAAPQPQSASPGQTPLDSHRALGAPKSFRNLTLIPVYDSAARPSDDYMTLDEGLKAKVVKVKESASGGTVNELYISNQGTKPLYLMGGEVVLGGQQDRCLGRDMIVKPGAKDLPVTVFCVEHGRWTGHREFDESAKTVASAGIRLNAQDAAFAASLPQTAASGRARQPGLSGPAQQMNAQQNRVQRTHAGNVAMAYEPIGQAQQKVWAKVEEKNRRFKAAPATGTYRDVLNQSGGEAQRSIDPYVKALSESLGRDPHLVGVVAAVNGQVTAADVFGDPSLFRKLWPKLLRSYSADAAENATGKPSAKPVTAAQAKEFLVAASDSKSKTENRSDVSTTLRLESKTSLSYRLMPASAKPSAGLGGGGFGGALHESVLRK